jgi:hypothetical protein
MTKLTPKNLCEILRQLHSAQLDVVLVGGQAVNFWAELYYPKIPDLNQYLPFASEDLDFYGGRLEALSCHKILGGEVFLNKDFDPSPNTGVVLVDFLQQKLRIDFLGTIYGVSEAEIYDTAIPFLGKGELEGIDFKILHPILCLEGKLHCLRHLSQVGRQDLKHVKMSLLCLQEYLKELANSNKVPPVNFPLMG